MDNDESEIKTVDRSQYAEDRYQKGLELERACDDAGAFELFGDAAACGHAAAQFKLFEYYYLGRGVKSDRDKSIAWLKSAAENGCVEAQTRLGEEYYYYYGLLKQDYAEAVKWLGKAASAGVASAQHKLAKCYIGGYGGAARDPAKFCYWCTKAAENGYAPAQHDLGDAHYSDAVKNEIFESQWGRSQWGWRTPYSFYGLSDPNFKDAVMWFMKAAEQGYARSEMSLYYCYLEGRGVRRDEAASVEWLKKSAEHGWDKAKADLGSRYYDGAGVEQNYELAVKLLSDIVGNNELYYRVRCYKRANKVVHDSAPVDPEVLLGNCYRYGYFVDIDLDKAEEYYRLGVERGHDAAKYALESFIEERKLLASKKRSGFFKKKK